MMNEEEILKNIFKIPNLEYRWIDEEEILKDIFKIPNLEYRWIDEEKFCIWVSYHFLTYFIEMLAMTIGIEPSDDLDAQIQPDCLCIVLNKNLIDTNVLEEMFPKKEE